MAYKTDNRIKWKQLKSEFTYGGNASQQKMPALDASRNFVTGTVCNAAMTSVTILKAVDITQSVTARKFKG